MHGHRYTLHCAQMHTTAVIERTPASPVLDVQLPEQVLNVGVGTKEDVQAGLVPITVLVLPCRNLCVHTCRIPCKADVC